MINAASPLEAFQHWVSSTPDNIFLRQPANRIFREYTYREADEHVRKIANFLIGEGIRPGDKVALLSKNCAHWFMADLAIMMAGAVSVPLYATLGPEDIAMILEHSEAVAAIVGKLDNYEEQQAGVTTDLVIGIREYGIPDGHSWEDIVAAGDPLDAAVKRAPDDLITLIYTSGTTGVPKGVMHSIRNFDVVVKASLHFIDLPPHPRYFSYLPLSHIAERIGIQMASIYRGAAISFPETIESFGDDLASVRPHLFLAVPRIWQKFKEKILEKMPQHKLDRLLKIPLVKGLVRKKIRKALGLSSAMAIYSGAAPISRELQEWFGALGVDILQAYGMTEDCILSHYNLQGENVYGSVGRPLPGVTTRISPEGEIQLHNESLMKGYFKAPELTAETLTADGFLCTGDVGEYDENGYLWITGRIKDQFKTDKGKFVSPAHIELELLSSADIEQACVVGTALPQPIALIILSEAARAGAQQEIFKNIERFVSRVNERLAAHEKLAKAVILQEPWSMENGFMTPTLKLKRGRVEEKHRDSYINWYDQKEIVLAE